MKKYLITGISGFVANYFIKYLEDNRISSSVLGIDTNSLKLQHQEFKYVNLDFEKIDLLDREKIENVIYNFQPDYLLHLASYSSVAFSWKNPVDSFRNNTNIFLNLIDAIRKLEVKCRVLSVGSSEEYGDLSEEDIPLREDCPLKPVSPYAVARVSQEMLSKIYVDGYGLDIIMTRSFNHIGLGQREIFVISSFARQLSEMKKNGMRKGEIIAGDVSIVRDFLDVRDVVAAYYKLFKNGIKGEVYNICSGKGHTLKEIIELMAHILEITVDIKLEPSLIRPGDNKVIIGGNSKIKREIGWENKIILEDSLRDVIGYWMNDL